MKTSGVLGISERKILFDFTIPADRVIQYRRPDIVTKDKKMVVVRL